MKNILYKLTSLLYILCTFLIAGCSPSPTNVQTIDKLPPIFPDYVDVTLPPNIAPAVFSLRGDYKNMIVTADGNECSFDETEWHKLLEKHKGKAMEMKVVAQKESGEWVQFKPFSINVAEEPIDSFMTYRLIEPDYEVFSHLQIQERNITNFDTRNICDYELVGNRCMNCHTYGQNRPDLSFMYVRGEGGGMILNRNGALRKLNIKTPEMTGGAVYAQFSPNGRYLVFSTNNIIPSFHSEPEKRMEVYDATSDVYVADLETNTVISSTLLADTTKMETFPCFTPDGKSIIYCKADFSRKAEEMNYSLYRIGFDENTGKIAEEEECIFEATVGEKTSVCHPRVSPDGQYLLFTVADFGTFPLWHREADQRMMRLKTDDTGNYPVDSLDIVNSELSDSYHSWGSNSRWFVFASKRHDGLYGRPFICYIDKNGKAHKPFALPQKHPLFYDNCLKSFNAPELGRAAVAFDPDDVQQIMKQESESFMMKND